MLAEANVTGTDLSGADLRGVDFSRAQGLRFAQLVQAYNYSGIVLPDESKTDSLLRNQLDGLS